jgi:hypothetical protein
MPSLTPPRHTPTLRIPFIRRIISNDRNPPNCPVHGGGLRCLLNVDSSRPVRANSGRSRRAWRTAKSTQGCPSDNRCEIAIAVQKAVGVEASVALRLSFVDSLGRVDEFSADEIFGIPQLNRA